MKKIKLLVSSIIISTSFLVSTSAFAIDNINKPNVTRLVGQDRYQTCNKIVDTGWTQSNYAILVNSNMFSDAITSSPLAKKSNAPILLTEGNNLTTSTKEQLQKLDVKTVYIIGGTGVLSDSVVTAITGNDISNLSLDTIPDNTDLTETQKNNLLLQLEGKWYKEIYLKDKNVTIPYDGKIILINKNKKFQLVIGYKNDAQGEIIEKIKKVSKNQYLFYGKDYMSEYSTLFTIDINRNSLTLVYAISNQDNNKVSYNESFIRTDLVSSINKVAYIGKFKDSNNKTYEFKDDLTAVWPDKNFKYSLQQLDNMSISYIFTSYDSNGNVANRYISEDENNKRVFYSTVENTEKWTDADPAYVKDKQLFILTK